MSEFTFIAVDRIGDVWFNRSLDQFAIIPGRDEISAEALAEVISELAGVYREAGQKPVDDDTQNEVLAELYDLHERGLILWPLGLQFRQSALGTVTSRRLWNFLSVEDPTVCEIRDQVERSEAFKDTNVKGAKKTELSFDFWRIFMTVRLASVAGSVAMPRDITETHLMALVSVLYVDGDWLDWVPEWTPRRLRKFRDYLSIERSEKKLALGFMNRKRGGTNAARALTVITREEHLNWLVAAFDVWLDSRVAMTKKMGRSGLTLLLDYLGTLRPEDALPSTAFRRENMTGFFEFASTWSTLGTRALAVPKVFEFAEWYYHEFSVEHPSGTLGMTRVDVDRFLKRLPPLQASSGEVRARPMPVRLQQRLLEIIAEDDFAWPKSLMDRATRMPSNWISWTDPETGVSHSVFCEVLPRLMMLQLEMPWRNIQIRRLDSGEGDDKLYDKADDAWKSGTGPNAGYWSSNNARNPRRGVLREISTLTGVITGFWVNSNKTADRKNSFDETSGYQVSWQHDAVIDNILALRAWQEKYNPVSGPLPYARIPKLVFVEDPSRDARAVLPDRFYLFRYPLNKWERGNEAPPSYHLFLQFFYSALEELERRLVEEDGDAAPKIITGRDVTGRPRKAIFTPHGLRVATLTALYDAGAPIGILSKLVAGHATILMTLRYIKQDPAHISDVLEDARTRALEKSRDQFVSFLRSATIEQAMRMTARLSDDGVIQAKTKALLTD